jgi:natural product precursor
MKLKKINKKLALKKETIASLANKDLQKINGGSDLSMMNTCNCPGGTVTTCMICDPSLRTTCVPI